VSLSFEWGDALELPYADDAFDAATVGFGARNFSDLQQGLREMARVVRPGGRVVVLEMTTPTRPPLSIFYRVWFDRIVPLIGRLAGIPARLRSRPGSSWQTTIAQAYTYLPNSVKRFHSPTALAGELERAGCTGVGYVLMAGGIIAVHGATVREDATPWAQTREHETGYRPLGRGERMTALETGTNTAADVEAVEEIMRRGGPALRGRMARVEAHLEAVTMESGTPLASHATATVVAGGKRLRPLLVVLAAE
jgi:hypothetical protein